MWSRINARTVMPAYEDERDGKWRYRKRVTLPDGRAIRIGGTPATNTKKAAEAAERAHIDRVLNPERARAQAEVATERKEVPTFREFEDRFMKEYLPRQKPSERYSKESILKGQLLPFFGDYRLDEVDQPLVNAYVAALKVSSKTVNNRLAVLSSLLGYAHTCKLIPAPQLDLHIAGMSAEVVAVPSDEVAKLIAAAGDPRYRVGVLLAAEAGLRIGEIRGLQWADINDGHVTIRRAVDTRNHVGSPKHDKRRTVPLSQTLIAELASLPRRGVWVVSRLDGGMLGYWAALEALHKIYARAGVAVPTSETGETMPWHSLRHTFGTQLAANGVPLPTIKELMGHADIATTMRYVTVTAGQMSEAIAKAFGQQVANRSAERL